jgi:NADH:ubiquinone oxidoreductase subunit
LHFSSNQAYFEAQESLLKAIMAKINIFGALTNVQMLIKTLFSGERVGTDSFGNVYYRGKPRPRPRRERRWVIYKDRPDASTVPPEWHGWLHHQTSALPAAENKYRQPWQKPPLPNMTGTAQAYTPPGLRGERDAATGDYAAWAPPQ